MDEDGQLIKIKCYVCNKTVRTVEQLYCKCRCGYMFCKLHRAPGLVNNDCSHKCEYDYRIEGMKDLQLQMPKIISDKISKI